MYSSLDSCVSTCTYFFNSSFFSLTVAFTSLFYHLVAFMFLFIFLFPHISFAFPITVPLKVSHIFYSIHSYFPISTFSNSLSVSSWYLFLFSSVYNLFIAILLYFLFIPSQIFPISFAITNTIILKNTIRCQFCFFYCFNFVYITF